MSSKRFTTPYTKRSGRFRLDERGHRRPGLLKRIQIGEAFTIRRTLVMLGLVVLSLLPHLWGPRLVPYRLRQVLRQPIHSRLTFQWENREEAEERAQEVRSSFAPYFTDVPNWADSVFNPVYDVLNKAHTLAVDGQIQLPDAVIQLQNMAAEKKVEITPQEATAIMENLRNQWRRLSFYWDIIAPARGVLISELQDVGILSPDKYKDFLGQPIRISSPRYGVKSSPPVGSAEGPLSVEAVPRLLDAYFDVEYGRFDVEFRRALSRVISRRIEPSLRHDAARSGMELEKELARMREVVGTVQASEVLMSAGRPIEPADLRRIRAEARSFEEQRGRLVGILRMVGAAALLIIAGSGYLLYLLRFEKLALRRSGQLVGVLLVSILVLWLVHLGMLSGLRVTLVPMGIMAAIAALIFGPRVGVGTASLICFTSFIITETDFGQIVSLLGASWVFCCLAPGVRRRTGLLRAGFLSGGISFLVTSFWRLASGTIFSLNLADNSPLDFFFWLGGYEAVMWISGGILLTVLLPLVERAFDATTNVTLLELSDQEHPCLRRLVLEAPGTYHHSVVVGNLAEAAAEVIGANPLLARVGSYYHDIGKVIKPEYFNENESGHSRHDNLSPTISTLIIIAHVKDGVEMAKAYDLPHDIIEIIEQHHGDTMVGYFYNRAREQAKNEAEIAPASYRYPGPKPQSREAAIVHMADSIEAASRSLTEPTPAHIESMVDRIIHQKLLSGQLDDSPLTFRDVTSIERSFVRTLNAMFHSRVTYPGTKKKEDAQMIHIDNATSITVDEELISKVLSETLAARLTEAAPEETDVYLQLLTDNQILILNETHKERKAPTDVLAFADGEVDPDDGRVHLGDIAISLETASQEADSRAIPVNEEALLYALHGLLHLLGWRDGSEEEETAMRQAEREELAKWEITPDW